MVQSKWGASKYILYSFFQLYLTFHRVGKRRKKGHLKFHHCCCTVAKLCLILCNPWTVDNQAPLSMGFPR